MVRFPRILALPNLGISWIDPPPAPSGLSHCHGPSRPAVLRYHTADGHQGGQRLGFGRNIGFRVERHAATAENT